MQFKRSIRTSRNQTDFIELPAGTPSFFYLGTEAEIRTPRVVVHILLKGANGNNNFVLLSPYFFFLDCLVYVTANLLFTFHIHIRSMLVRYAKREITHPSHNSLFP